MLLKKLQIIIIIWPRTGQDRTEQKASKVVKKEILQLPIVATYMHSCILVIRIQNCI